MMLDIIVFENSPFRLSTRKLEAGILKNSTLESVLLRCVFGDHFHRLRVDGGPNWREKPPFSNKSGYVWSHILTCILLH